MTHVLLAVVVLSGVPSGGEVKVLDGGGVSRRLAFEGGHRAGKVAPFEEAWGLCFLAFSDDAKRRLFLVAFPATEKDVREGGEIPLPKGCPTRPEAEGTLLMLVCERGVKR